MPAQLPDPSDHPISADVIELERALMRIAYLLTRFRWHDQIRIAAGVQVDRAGVVILRQLADGDAMRPGELAAELEVEPPHVTRQLQRLAHVGYVDRIPDPADRRAQLIRLTPDGQEAADRIQMVIRQAMVGALGRWAPRDLHRLATLFHRMVDDFLAYADAFMEGPGNEDAGTGPAGPEGAGTAVDAPARTSGDATPGSDAETAPGPAPAGKRGPAS